MKFKGKFFSCLIYLAFLFCLLPVAIFTCKHPAYNWDMLAYMALVVKMENKDINDVHKITYSSARQNIPKEDYGKLIEGDLRKVRAESSAEFNRILPLYTVKPLYIWSSYVFYKAGFSLPLSTVLPSLVAYLLIGLLLFHWLSRHHKLFFSFAAALLIMLSSIMIAAAKLSTPDCISAFFLFSAFYFILERPSVLFAFLFFVGSVLVRLDNIILSFLLLTFLFLGNKWERKISFALYIGMLAVLTVVYILISSMTKEYNWDLLYYSTFIKYYNPEHQAHSSFSISNYLVLFSQRAVMAIVNTQFSLFFLFVIVMVNSHLPMKLRNLPFELLFCVLLVLTILFRFVLFPDLEDRFYIAYYMVILVVLMQQLKHIRSILKTERQKQGQSTFR